MHNSKGVGFRNVPSQEATLSYQWKPGPDWERLREIEQKIAAGESWSATEVIELARRTHKGLGLDAEVAQCADRDSQVAFVVEARKRIREGSRRLGELLIAVEAMIEDDEQDAAEARIREFLKVEVVPFYLEIAENHLAELRD
jgi:DUSAM domain-containing protein